MARFNLIQRGVFKDVVENNVGLKDIVTLSYMGAAEFEWGAIPKAYNCLMYYFKEYEVFHTGIYTPELEELLLYCRKKYKATIIQKICEFINEPYYLKSFSELEKVKTSKKDDISYNRRRSNFWWCIDKNEEYGNWMAFLDSKKNLLTQAIEYDYHNYFEKKTDFAKECTDEEPTLLKKLVIPLDVRKGIKIYKKKR